MLLNWLGNIPNLSGLLLEVLGLQKHIGFKEPSILYSQKPTPKHELLPMPATCPIKNMEKHQVAKSAPTDPTSFHKHFIPRLPPLTTKETTENPLNIPRKQMKDMKNPGKPLKNIENEPNPSNIFKKWFLPFWTSRFFGTLPRLAGHPIWKDHQVTCLHLIQRVGQWIFFKSCYLLLPGFYVFSLNVFTCFYDGAIRMRMFLSGVAVCSRVMLMLLYGFLLLFAV